MKSIIVMALILGFTVHALDAKAISNKSQEISAKSKGKGKSEPTPKEDDRKGGGDETDPRQGTYEGNDRDGGTFDGGGYTGGDEGGGGFAGEIFSNLDGRTYPSRTTTSVEDRGEVLVYTTQIQEDISASETCVTTIVSVVDKASGKSMKTDTDRFCNVIGY